MFKKKTYTEAELIKGCVDNDRRCQEFLYKRYFDTMWRMIRKHCSDDEEALSVLNMGYLRVFQNITSFAFKGSFEGWMRRIIYHVLIEHMRQKSKYLQFIILDDTQGVQIGKSQATLDHMYADDLLILLDHLPPMSAKVFQLYAIEGYNHREIGEILKMSENTSKWHLANARKHLQDKLTNRNKQNNIAG
jgi:RNA polymerase sigma factor (sigma-70 family)